MVAGKVKLAMGLQNPPPNPKPDPSPLPLPTAANVPAKRAVFSRSFGVYFPRATTQVQPRPQDVMELLHLVEDLRERESRLKTQLLEQKLLNESASILSRLETEISLKDTEIDRCQTKIECLETENNKLRHELELLHTTVFVEKREVEMKVKSMEAEISNLKRVLSERRIESEEFSSSPQRFQELIDVSVKSNLIKKLRKGAKITDIAPIHENSHRNEVLELNREDVVEGEISDFAVTARSRVPRVPKPPPRPSSSSSSSSSQGSSDSVSSAPPLKAAVSSAPPLKAAAPPPPPPPPLANGLRSVPASVRRVPEVVEFYHSLMRRYSRRDSGGGGGGSDGPAAANPRDMIGEIENRSAHLLAIKTDVETQGDFIRFLIKEVEDAAFTDIEDVVPFVKWLDDELSYLVDERAVLKHFDWPEQKADALREAAFGYSDLKKLESESSSFLDYARQPCAPALKKMQALFEKLEHGVFNLSRMRDSATKRYKVFQIPTNWMLDTGCASQMKLASVKLAMKYMKRVSSELEIAGGGPEEEELIVQGVRFAFRVHQFAGGFDVETMKAFQELRDKAISCHVQCQNQQQEKLLCRSTAC